MKLLITGGAGFIGSNYLTKILGKELAGVTKVVVLDKLTYAGKISNLNHLNQNDFEFVRGDICDVDLTSQLIADCDAVINFAAESHVDRSITGSRDFVLSNVLGTQTLLNAVRKRSGVTFLQVSTDEVYGSVEKGSSLESDNLEPNSPYAASKAAADLICRSFVNTYGIDVRITRCSNNYGPRQYPEKLIPVIITNLIKGLDIPIYGNGLNVRDWLHVDDHCRAIHAVLLNGSAGEIYNIGGGQEFTNLNLAKIIVKHMGEDESRIKFVQDRLAHDQRYSVNWEKLSNELGYSPEISFENGISQTIEWYLQNQPWWDFSTGQGIGDQ
jgi:dTDP-glucose 4,6-dehydratase